MQTNETHADVYFCMNGMGQQYKKITVMYT